MQVCVAGKPCAQKIQKQSIEIAVSGARRCLHLCGIVLRRIQPSPLSSSTSAPERRLLIEADRAGKKGDAV